MSKPSVLSSLPLKYDALFCSPVYKSIPVSTITESNTVEFCPMRIFLCGKR